MVEITAKKNLKMKDSHGNIPMVWFVNPVRHLHPDVPRCKNNAMLASPNKPMIGAILDQFDSVGPVFFFKSYRGGVDGHKK